MSQPTSPRPKFDAYQAMLGIPPAEQPPHHYRLLGLPPFESDAARIAKAVNERAGHLQKFLDGPRGAEAVLLLTAVSAVQKVLANPTEKAKYDAQLKAAGVKPTDAERWSLPVEKEAGKSGLVKAKPLAPAAQPAAKTPTAKPLTPAVAPASPTEEVSPPPENASAKKSLLWLAPASAGGGFVLLLAIVLIVRAFTSTPEEVAANPTPAPTIEPTVPPPATPNVTPPNVTPPAVSPPVVKPIPVEVPQPTPPALPPVDPPEPAPIETPLPATPPPETPAAPPPAEEDQDAAQLREEIAAAKVALAGYPKFRKLYDQIQNQSASLTTKGPELAALMWKEANENPTIKQHLPSLLAALEEVERLAAAGNDFKTAVAALNARFEHHPALPPADYRAAKSALVLESAKVAAEPRAKPSERTEAKEQLRALVAECIEAADEKTLEPLLAANASLAKTSAERLQAVVDLLPTAEAALDDERIAAAATLSDHLDGLMQNVTAAKAKQDAQERFDVLRGRVKIASNALAAEKTLATSPDDAQAHSLIGLHLLVNRGDLHGALEHLAQGHVKAWADLATETLAAKDGRTRASLAERWSGLSTNPKSPAKLIAREILDEALADASLVGIARAAAEGLKQQLGPTPQKKPTRVATAPETGKRPAFSPASASPSAKAPALALNTWTDLLPWIDYNEDLVRGVWYPAKGGVKAESSIDSRIRLPIDLSGTSYEMQVEFELGADADDIYVLLPVGATSAMLIVDGFQSHTVSYFSDIRGAMAPALPEALHIDLLKPNTTHRYDVSVQLNGDRARLAFSLDGKKRFEHEGPIHQLSTMSFWKLGTDAQPGLGTHETEVLFKTARVRVTNGRPKWIREKQAADPFPANVSSLKSSSLTAMSPVSASAWNNNFAVSRGPTFEPRVGGKVCDDYLFAHPPSRAVYKIPPKSKYFTAFACCAYNPSAKFIVTVDGKPLVQVANRAIAPVCVELPEQAKELTLEVDPLGSNERDQACWCYPAFRTAATGTVAKNERDPPKRPDKTGALPLNKWVELLPLIEFNEDVKRGYWYSANGGVQTESTTAAQVRLPVDLSDVSYDFQLEFDVGADADNVNAILPVGGTSVGLFVDVLDARTTYLCNVDNRPAWSNPRAIREDLLKPNRSHRYDVSVRLKGDEATIDFSLNGAQVFSHTGPIRSFSLFNDWKLGVKDSLLGFGAHETPVVFKSCRVKVVEGTAEYTRDKPADPFPAEVRKMRSESLTKLKPLSGTSHNNSLAMSTSGRDPVIDGKDCKDYIFAHAPSRVTFEIPPGAKYFTGFAYAARSASVKFVVRANGRELFTCERTAIQPFAVELPAGSKILELECDPLGDLFYDWSCWCYPAFRR